MDGHGGKSDTQQNRDVGRREGERWAGLGEGRGRGVGRRKRQKVLHRNLEKGSNETNAYKGYTDIRGGGVSLERERERGGGGGGE